MENKIPKIIHYCWFGGNPLPDPVKKCIESWKKNCPDYQIIQWNETNFNVNYNLYTKEAYEAKKWAFVSDVARLYALVTYGGIYADTDVEFLKPLDDVLIHPAFSCIQKQNRNIATSFLGCKKGHELFNVFLHEYDNIHFKLDDGSYDFTTNVVRMTKICKSYGYNPDIDMQSFADFTIFPSEYFCPKNPDTGALDITKNTYVIHHFDATWKSDAERKAIQFAIKYQKFLPIKVLKFIGTIKYGGFNIALKKLWREIKK